MPQAKTLLYEKNNNRRRARRGEGRDVTIFPKAEIDHDHAVYVVCCIDSTDDLSGEMSTGFIAEQVAGKVAELGGQVMLGITRHQLLLAEGVPYTSHNSAMSFSAVMPGGEVFALRSFAIDAILRFKAETSDPGLCIAELPLNDVSSLIGAQIALVSDFGQKAKCKICTKNEAYETVRSIPWLVLSEHGGTGAGIIGALAGLGLRLNGEDGRFRGRWDLAKLISHTDTKVTEREGERPVMDVKEFCEALESLTLGGVQVLDQNGDRIDGSTLLELSCDAKPIMRNGALTFMVKVHDGLARPFEKDDLGEIGNQSIQHQRCEHFEPDNDVEERLFDSDDDCCNCLYRRWLTQGFYCMVEDADHKDLAGVPNAVLSKSADSADAVSASNEKGAPVTI